MDTKTSRVPFIRRGRKVEYFELIYDLIFVFMLQQDDALLHPDASGFFGATALTTYLLSTLIVLQVWGYSALYINRYGENTVLDFVFVFLNMYLLYFMGVQTRSDWWQEYQSYNTAWALILINLGIQNLLKAHRVAPRHPRAKHLTRVWAIFYFIEAGLVLLTIPIFRMTGRSFVWVAVVVGFAGPLILSKDEEAMPVSFGHLSERVMLFVVFTFGEMIVSITEYFKEMLTWDVFIVSGCAFLTIIGLFRSYGYLYNHVVDRNEETGHRLYLLIHIVIILALSFVAICLEYLRVPDTDDLAAAALLSGSCIVYYACLYLITPHPNGLFRGDHTYILLGVLFSAAFVGVMPFIYHNVPAILIASTCFVWAQFTLIVKRRWALVRLRSEARQHNLEDVHASSAH